MISEHGEKRILIAGQWSLALPEGWTYRIARHSTALFKEDGGVGAVNVSSIRGRARSRKDALELVDNFATGLNLRAVGQAVRVPAPQGCAAAALQIHENEDTYWLMHAIVSLDSSLLNYLQL